MLTEMRKTSNHCWACWLYHVYYLLSRHVEKIFGQFRADVLHTDTLESSAYKWYLKLSSLEENRRRSDIRCKRESSPGVSTGCNSNEKIGRTREIHQRDGEEKVLVTGDKDKTKLQSAYKYSAVSLIRF